MWSGRKRTWPCTTTGRNRRKKKSKTCRPCAGSGPAPTSPASLKELEQAVQEKKNVMPFLVDCCRAYCTVGEMTRVFKEAYGTFEEPSIF